MAVQNSSQVANLVAVPKVELSVKQRDGRVRIARFDFAQVGAGAANDEANLCDLPAGARVLLGLCYIRNSAADATQTISLGTRAHKNAQTGATIAENAIRWLNVSTLGANAIYTMFPAANGYAGAALDDTDTVLGEARVFVKFGTAGPSAGKKLTGEMFYVVD
jgi:hypothetical protein